MKLGYHLNFGHNITQSAAATAAAAAAAVKALKAWQYYTTYIYTPV